MEYYYTENKLIAFLHLLLTQPNALHNLSQTTVTCFMYLSSPGEVASGQQKTMPQHKYPASVSLAARAAAGVLRPTPRHAPAMDLSFSRGLLTVMDVTSPVSARSVHPQRPNNNNYANIIHNSNIPFHVPPSQCSMHHSIYKGSVLFGLLPSCPPASSAPSPTSFSSPPTPPFQSPTSQFATPTSVTPISPSESYQNSVSSPRQASPHEYSESPSSPKAPVSSASPSSPEEQPDEQGKEYVHKKLRFSRKLRQDEASLCTDPQETSHV